MKVASVNNNFRTNNNKTNNVAFTGSPRFKIAKFLGKNPEVGEGASVAVDFIGKALVAPLFIIFNPISKEPKDKKQYSALKNPIAGIIQLAMEAPIVAIGYRYLEKLSKDGKLHPDFNLKGVAKAEEKAVQKRLGVMQARFCFLVSLALTLPMCKLENYIHPKFMKGFNAAKANKLNKSNQTPQANKPAEVIKNEA